MKRSKTCDAVGIMRAIRDRMSREMEGMTSRQQIAYIRKKSGLSPKESPRSARTCARAGRP
jgi:hypothetical protein